MNFDTQQFLSIIISVISVIGTLGAFDGIKYLCKHKVEKRISKKEEEEAHDKELREKEKEDKLLEKINENYLLNNEQLKNSFEKNICEINTKIEKLAEKLDDTKSDSISIKKGLQSVLRDRLYQLNNVAVKAGYATVETKVNFENMYTIYHSLGTNGVMDNTHDQFMQLPTEPKKRVSKNKNK